MSQERVNINMQSINKHHIINQSYKFVQLIKISWDFHTINLDPFGFLLYCFAPYPFVVLAKNGVGMSDCIRRDARFP